MSAPYLGALHNINLYSAQLIEIPYLREHVAQYLVDLVLASPLAHRCWILSLRSIKIRIKLEIGFPKPEQTVR